MKGQALIKRFQSKNRELKESAEFEKFLDSHERAWMDYETAQQGRGMKGIRRPGAVVRPAITRDDIGGPNVVNQLRKSRNPEADLDGLIRSAERNGDNERAARLKDFQTEFQFQKQEITAGIRQGYEDLNRTYARAGIGELGQQEKERNQQQYMTPHATAMAQAGMEQGGGADIKVQKFADGSVGGSISGTATATGDGSHRLDDGYSDIAQALRNNLRSLGDSNSNPELLQKLQNLKKQIDSVDEVGGLDRDQKKARKQEFYKQVQALLLQAKGRGEDGQAQQPAQQAQEPQSSGDAAQALIGGIDKVQQAPPEQRAQVARKEIGQQPKPFERTLSNREREHRANLNALGRSSEQTPAAKQAKAQNLQYGGGGLYYDRETGDEYRNIDGEIKATGTSRRMPGQQQQVADPWGEPKPIDADEVRANQERDQQARYDRERRARGTDEREPGEVDAPRDEYGEPRRSSNYRSGGPTPGDPVSVTDNSDGSELEQKFDRTRQALRNAGYDKKVSEHIAALDAIAPKSLIGNKSQLEPKDVRTINQLDKAKVTSVINQLNDRFGYPRQADGFDAVADAQEQVPKEILDRLVAKTVANQDTKSVFADIDRALAGKATKQRKSTKLDPDAPLPEGDKRELIQSRVSDYIADKKLLRYADQIGDVIYSNTDLRTGADLDKVADYVFGDKAQGIVDRFTRVRQVMGSPADESLIDTQIKAQGLINGYEPNYGEKLNRNVGDYILNGGDDIDGDLRKAREFERQSRYNERIGKPDFSKRDTKGGVYPEGQQHKEPTQKGLKQISDIINGSDMPIEEDKRSEAAKQAQSMGLKHIGFGMYADANGTIVARTVDGKLVPVNQDEVDTIGDVLGLKYQPGKKPKKQDVYAQDKGWEKLSSVPNTYQTEDGQFVRYVPGTGDYVSIPKNDLPAKWHANQQGFTPVGKGTFVKNGKEFKWDKKKGEFVPKGQKSGKKKGGKLTKAEMDKLRKLFKDNASKIKNEKQYGKQFDKSGKDPAIQNHLEMRKARIAAVRKQLNQLWDDLKKTDNPLVKERLKKQIAILDRQVGLEYLALERLKELAGITTATNKAAMDAIGALEDAVVETSKMNSDATGKQSAVFTVMGNLEKAGEDAVKTAFGGKTTDGKNEAEAQKERPVVDGLPKKETINNVEDYWKDLTYEQINEYEQFVDDDKLMAAMMDDPLYSNADYDIYGPLGYAGKMGEYQDINPEDIPQGIDSDAVNNPFIRSPEAPEATPTPRRRSTSRATGPVTRAKANTDPTKDPNNVYDLGDSQYTGTPEERAQKERSDDVRLGGQSDAGKAGAYSEAINQLDELELEPPYDNLRDVAKRILQRAQEERVTGKAKQGQQEIPFARKQTWDHATSLPVIGRLISVARTNPDNDIQNAFDLADLLDNTKLRRGNRLTDGEKYYATLLLDNILDGKNNASFPNVAEVLSGKENPAGESLLKSVIQKARELQKRNPLVNGRGEGAQGGEDFYTDISNRFADDLKNINTDSENRALRDGGDTDNSDLSDNEERPLPKLSQNMRRDPAEIEDRLYAYFVKGKGNQKMPDAAKDKEIVRNITNWVQGKFKASETNTPYQVSQGGKKRNVAYDDKELQGNMVREPSLDELERWQQMDDMSRYSEAEKKYLNDRLDKLTRVRQKGKEKLRGSGGGARELRAQQRADERGRLEAMDDDDIKEALTFMANLICEKWETRDRDVLLMSQQAAVVREMLEVQEQLQKENQFLSEHSGPTFNLNERIEAELWALTGVSGMDLLEDLREEVDSLNAEQYLRYRLAYSNFKDLNPYYSFSESFASALHAAHYGSEPQKTHVTKVIEKNEHLWDEEQFLYELARTAVEQVASGERELERLREHCGCEEKDKLLVDKGPQRVKEIPAQKAPAPSRKPQTAQEILAAHKPPRKKLSLRRNK